MTETDAPSTPATPARGGLFRSHRRGWTIAGSAVAIALLAGTALASGAAAGSPAPSATQKAAASATPSATPTPTPDPRATPAAAVPASRLRTCSVTDLASDGRLASMQAQVLNAATGEVLFDRGGTTPSRAASVMKVLTTAAALKVLGPDYRATTTVVKGAEPGSAVLVGGGDLTLSRLPSGETSAYEGAAHLDDLANQVRTAWAADPSNPPLTTLILDSTLFTGPDWQPSWDTKEQYDGYMSRVTALQVDGDRDDPYSNTSARSDDPIGRAGQAFADQLGGIQTIELGTAPAGAAALGSVQSAPVSTLVQQSLIVSDNTIAEMLARLTAVTAGTGSDFSAIQPAVVAALDSYGVDTAGIVVVDGSGLSDDNAIPPSYLTRLFVKINAREANLGVIADGLPVAGRSGSLSYSDRFTGEASVADGSVFAKTGWIDTGYTLSGIIAAADGTPLTFAVYALGDVTEDAKTAIDLLTAGFYSCGDNLSNN
ncbi:MULTISPECIES: D-alanyl-D-alanine carboxypeptidase/D-alanyl-D-alanine-endopeptidase [unclassified Leifsonia]|uniref:D-alanyl-D-alanine carboxypeptidase/D-alanyl-D-alanine-endopeptidase n=1 Tax=unclassified Leifsonia TaxID=2663824 RepID=UPI0009EBE57E|nr:MULTISPECIES: D-alanyl-D-alanine carboxypeptidase [unclassified Leifsonia]